MNRLGQKGGERNRLISMANRERLVDLFKLA